MGLTKQYHEQLSESREICQWCGVQLEHTGLQTTIGLFCTEQCADAAQEQYMEDNYTEYLKTQAP
jgi:hypothetical protein